MNDEPIRTEDTRGKVYARLSETKAGDYVSFDENFTCGIGETTRIVKEEGGQIYVECDDGRHYLAPQAEDNGGDYMIGVYPA